MSNLNRQVLHDESRIGMNKAESAKMTIKNINPNVEVEVIKEKITVDNIHRIASEASIIFDMLDGVEDKFILSSYAKERGIPHIISAMIDLNGYSAFFYSPETPCFHCVFDKDKLSKLLEGTSRNKNYEKKSLAVTSPSLFMSTGYAVNEALKYILGIGSLSFNKFLYFNSRGDTEFISSDSYISMTYLFTENFKSHSLEQGFDWDKGWRGKNLEELIIKKNPECNNCGPDSNNSIFPYKIEKYKINNFINSSVTNQSEKRKISDTEYNNVVAVYLDPGKDFIISALSIWKSRKSLLFINPNWESNKIIKTLHHSKINLIISNTLYIKQLKEFLIHVNHDIQILNCNKINKNYLKNETTNNLNYNAYISLILNNNKLEFKTLSNNELFLNILEGKTEKEDNILNEIISNFNDILNTKTIETSNKDDEIIGNELRSYLGEYLPEYMIPAKFIPINNIPLTANGKIDSKKLKEIESSYKQNFNSQQATTKLEKDLLQIWIEVIGNNNISINDSFYAVGGDSIKAIQIANRTEDLGFNLEVSDILKNPRLVDIISIIQKQSINNIYSPTVGKVPLSPIQSFYLTKDKNYSKQFNILLSIVNKDRFDINVLRKSWNIIIKYHDILRTTFNVENDGSIIQYVQDMDFIPEIEIVNLKGQEEQLQQFTRKVNTIQKSINIANRELVKLVLFDLDKEDKLIFIIHHIIFDQASINILLNDFNIVYNEIKNGAEGSLPSKTNSYKDWCEHLYEYAHSNLINNEISYWEQVLMSYTKIIPKDYNYNINLVKDIRSVSFKIEKKETDLLLKNTNNRLGTNVLNVLLINFGLTLYEIFNLNETIIFLEHHGRGSTFSNIKLDRTIGWFSNIYPIIIDNIGNIEERIEKLKNHFTSIPNEGIGYGILKYLKQNIDESNNILKVNPQVIFNYSGELSDNNLESNLQNVIEQYEDTISPELERFAEIEISVKIVNNELNCKIYFNQKQYKNETIQNISDIYFKNLINTINILSDDNLNTFTYKKLSPDQIKNISSQFKVEDIYELSSMQEYMLYSNICDLSSKVNFLQFSYFLNEEIDKSKLQESLEILFRRHDILRTVFIYENLPEPLQIVIKDRIPQINFVDLRNVKNREDEIKEFLKNDKDKPFDLQKDILFRISLLQLGESNHLIIWSINHILFDGWSKNILIAEFYEIYKSKIEKESIQLKPVIPYKNYIKWIKSQDVNSAKIYWRNYLANFNQLSTIPTNKILISKQYENESYTLELDALLFNKLKSIASQFELTLNNVIQTCWGIVLCKYSNKKDIVFGNAVSGKPAKLKGIENMIGLFTNTVPLRLNISTETSFVEISQKVKNNFIDTEGYQYYPLNMIIEESHLNLKLFDHIIVYQNSPIYLNSVNNIKDKSFNEVPDLFGQSNYNLNVFINQSNSINIRFQYNSNYYSELFIKRLMDHLVLVFEEVTKDPFIKIDSIEFFTDDEKKTLHNKFYILEKHIRDFSGITDVTVLENYHQKIYAFLVCDETISTLQLRKHLRKYTQINFSMEFVILNSIPLCSDGNVDKEYLIKNYASENAITIKLPGSEIEKTIAEIWKSVLSIKEVYLNNTFIEVGGNSILVPKVINLIKKELEIEPDISDFFNQSLAQFSKKIEQKIKSVEKFN